jgi:hypothetical protein
MTHHVFQCATRTAKYIAQYYSNYTKGKYVLRLSVTKAHMSTVQTMHCEKVVYCFNAHLANRLLSFHYLRPLTHQGVARLGWFGPQYSFGSF